MILSTHQRAQMGQIGLLLQLSLDEEYEPEDLLNVLLEMLEQENVLEGNA